MNKSLLLSLLLLCGCEMGAHYGYPAYTGSGTEPNVVAQWIFDELASPLVDEVNAISMAKAGTGTPTYNVAAAAPYTGISPGVTFDGATRFEAAAANANLDMGTQDFVFEFWFKTTYAGGHVVFTNQSHTTYLGYRVMLQSYTANGDLSLQLYSAVSQGRYDIPFLTDPRDGNLHKIRATGDRDGLLTVELDDEIQGIADISAKDGEDIPNYIPHIGCSPAHTGYFRGTLYELRVTLGNCLNDSGYLGVPDNLTFAWNSTEASIPHGWTRQSSADAKFPYGADAASDGGTVGGSATHTHPDTANHLHTFVAGAASGAQNYVLAVQSYAKLAHTHAVKNGANAIVTFGTASNYPSWYSPIYIKSGGTHWLQPNMVGWFEGALPSGWPESDGGGTRPDTRGKYQLGATAGADAGATGNGGVTSHNHSSDHSHAAVASNTPSATQKNIGGAGDEAAASTHTHSVSLNSRSLNLANTNGEPEYCKLVTAVNETGLETLPHGINGFYLGARADIAGMTDWEENTAMRSRFMKSATGVAQALDTGGTFAHAHTASAHNHAYTAGYGAGTAADNILGITSCNYTQHSHLWTIGTTALSAGDCGDYDAYPPYITAIWMRYTGADINPYSGLKPVRTLMGVGL